jgi:hypothetical protein
VPGHGRQTRLRADEVIRELNEIGPTVQSGTYHWYITDKIAEAVRWVGDKLMELGSWVLEKIKELAKGIAAPVTIWFTAHDWQDQVKGKASMVAGATGVKALRAPLVWKGDAADACTGAVWTQSGAATQIGNLGSSVAVALIVSAVAGLGLYGALAAVLFKSISATVEALSGPGPETAVSAAPAVRGGPARQRRVTSATGS